MLLQQQDALLADHADMRVVPLDADETPADRNRIVQLSPDHPGFRDPAYRARRNRIAQLALSYQPGEEIPEAPYTPEEHQVWRAVWNALEPAHRAHACAEYQASVQRLAFAPDRIPQLREVNEKVQAISGLPHRSIRFLFGIPLEPPRAAITASVRPGVTLVISGPRGARAPSRILRPCSCGPARFRG